MEYIILVGAALVRRWINIVGEQVVAAVGLMGAILLAVSYAGYVFFSDRRDR